MRRSALLILLALAAPPVAVAYAQPVTPDQADARFRDGNAAFKAKRYAEARAAYEDAFRFKHTHDIASNLGFAEIKLELWRDAATHLSFALRNWAPTGKAASRESTVEFLAIAKEKIATLTVTVTPGAEVLVDGKPLGTAPVEELYVDPGAHTIGARRDGFLPAEQAVQAEKGKTLVVTLTLMAAPPAPTASLSASAPPAPTAAPTTTAAPSFKPPKGLIIGAGALGLAGLAAGTGLTVAANKKASDAAALRLGQSGCAAPTVSAAQCAALHDAASSKVTLSNAAVSTFVAGSALALLATGLGIWATTDAPVRAVPTVGADHAGVTLLGVW